jgi:hypothetical protein
MRQQLRAEKELKISENSSSKFYQVKEKDYGGKFVLWGRRCALRETMCVKVKGGESRWGDVCRSRDGATSKRK